MTAMTAMTAMPGGDDQGEGGVFRVMIDGEPYELPRFCPHRGGRLDHGDVNLRRKTIRCPLHGSVFSIVTGEQLAGPTCGSLAITRPTTSGR